MTNAQMHLILSNKKICLIFIKLWRQIQSKAKWEIPWNFHLFKFLLNLKCSKNQLTPLLILLALSEMIKIKKKKKEETKQIQIDNQSIKTSSKTLEELL